MCPNSFYTLNFLGIRGWFFQAAANEAVEGGRSEVTIQANVTICSPLLLRVPFQGPPDDKMLEGGDGWGPPHTHTDGCGDPASDGKANRGTEVRPLSQVSQSRNGRPWTPIQPSWCPSLSTRLDHRPPYHSPSFPEHLGPRPCQDPGSLQPTHWAHLGWEVKIIAPLHRLGSGLRDLARAMKCRGWAAGVSPEPFQPRNSFP